MSRVSRGDQGRDAPTIPALAPIAQGTPAFDEVLAGLAGRGQADFEAVEPVVREILADVRRGGLASVQRYVEVLERRSAAPLVHASFDGEGALRRLPPELRSALEKAALRVERYHLRQVERGYEIEEGGLRLGLRVEPMRRVGVYAPGGKARYPSSVLMTAIPARIAGVPEIVLASPDVLGRASGDPGAGDLLLAAAHLAGVTTLLDAGGAHAIGALAFGVEGLERVDKIVGPGNAYVACAKRLVYGVVDIEGIAGPSEVLVLADETATAEVCASDLLSQAEHDEDAYPILLTTSAELAEAVGVEVERQLVEMSRRAIAEASIRRRAALLVVPDLDSLVAAANRIGAEHVSIHAREPRALAPRIQAGAIFVGELSPVAAGDYLAGPSHVLPTGGAVRFGSPLGVYDFTRRTSLIEYDAGALAVDAPAIAELASAEGLPGHGTSVAVRLEPPAGGGTPPDDR